MYIALAEHAQRWRNHKCLLAHTLYTSIALQTLKVEDSSTYHRCRVKTKLARLQLKTLLHLERVCEGRSLQACPPEDRRCNCWSAQRRLVCIAACCTLDSDSQQALTLKIILAETASAVSKDNRANIVSTCSGISRTILEATVISWPRSQKSKTAGEARQSSLQQHIYKDHPKNWKGNQDDTLWLCRDGFMNSRFPCCRRGVSEKAPGLLLFRARSPDTSCIIQQFSLVSVKSPALTSEFQKIET